MPIKSKIASGDINFGMILEKDWYTARVSKVQVVPSKAKPGNTNLRVDFEIINEKDNIGRKVRGVEIPRFFPNEAGVFRYSAPMMRAFVGELDTDTEYDYELLVGETCDIFVQSETRDDKQQNAIVEYAKSGSRSKLAA